MRLIPLAILLVGLGIGLPGCRIVKTDPKVEGAAAAGSEASETAHVDQVLADTLDSQLLPLITQKAVPLAELMAAAAADLDAAGQAHGNRGAGAGVAWTFAVKGEGVILKANLESRARKAEIDLDGDGQADVTLQLGPVIAGTALRDVAPFYDFGQFRDQIEFARLARAINDKVSATITLPPGDLTGRKISFIGVLPLLKPTDPLVVTAIRVEVAP
jgi:predicted lipoprotein